jgi:hypothetical protein
MIRGRDVRAGLRAGGAWLAASAVLILVGRLGGEGWGSLVGWLLIPLGLLGAPGQLAVNWGNLQKPAAGLNGFVAGSLAGVGGAAALLILGLPFSLWLLAPDSAAPGALLGATPILGVIIYTLAVICLILTAFTSTTLAIVEAPAAELEFPRAGNPGPRPD